jgi:hypothetical protein
MGNMPEPNRSTAMLIVKAWREHGAFRATISSYSDVVAGEGSEHAAAASAEELLSIIATWLRSV